MTTTYSVHARHNGGTWATVASGCTRPEADRIKREWSARGYPVSMTRD